MVFGIFAIHRVTQSHDYDDGVYKFNSPNTGGTLTGTVPRPIGTIWVGKHGFASLT